jgi:hypothetical protein
MRYYTVERAIHLLRDLQSFSTTMVALVILCPRLRISIFISGNLLVEEIDSIGLGPG